MKAPVWIAIFAALLYAQTLSYDYVLDDTLVIAENIFTQKGIEGIPGIWTHDTFYGFFQNEEKAQLVSGGRYRPFTLSLFALEGELFGFHPWVGHLFNCLFYALLCAMIYMLLFTLLQRSRKEYTHLAFWASLFFTTHPLHSEVVANIKGRDELLAFLGGLLASWVLLHGRKFKHLLFAFLFFIMGLFSKENAIVFLLLIPLLLYLVREKKTALWSFIPLGLGALLYLAVRSMVLGDIFNAGQPTELMNNPFMVWEGNTYDILSYWERLPTVILALGEYLRLFIWPWPLTHDYYPLQIPIVGYGHLFAWASFVFYLAVTVFALISLIKKRSVLGFSWLWWCIALFPMSNLLLNVGTLLSERFTFMASMGLCVILAYFIFQWRRKRSPLPILRKAIGIAIIGIYVLLTLIRTPAWSTNYELFTTDVKVSSESAKANNAAAGEYNARAGNALTEEEQQKWANKAIPHLKKALQLHPTYKNAYLQLGNSYFYINEYEKALENYQKALQLDPDYQDALNNIGLAYREAGQYYGEQKQDFQRALRYLKQAYSYRPNDYETIRLLGVAHGYAGNADKAANFFRKALRLRPGNSEAYYNLGVALMQTGKVDSGKYYIQQSKTMEADAYENEE